jgi:tRNA 5-methylaminomethyl-2-thiouridine biosynthesis bifunctional protein
MGGCLTAAELHPGADGIAFNSLYGDVYASRDGAFGQAMHVFLGGNGLPARWRGADQFVILENGFGLGTNFLATWQAWRDDPARPRRLHFVSVEQHPASAEDFRRFAPPEVRERAEELARDMPLPLPGLHRIEFEAGAVVLTLALGDARRIVPQLACGADALFLDGFAPDRNPQMWEPALMKAFARLARPGATLATWCTARAVRDALSACGFELELRAGFGRKRQMLAGRFVPRWRVRRHEPPGAYRGERSAVVVGAGLAGANAAFALARRGWQVQVVEQASMPAADASSLPWGLLHPLIAADDSLLARLTRAGFRTSLRALQTLAPEGRCGERRLWQGCGVFQQARDAAEADAWRAIAQRMNWPAPFVRWIEAGEAHQLVGLRTRRGGWWFGDGAIVSARAWCQQALVPETIRLRCAHRVDRIERCEDGWRVLAGTGTLGPVAVVVIASALEAPRLLGTIEANDGGPAPVIGVRGRITRIDGTLLAGLHAGLTGDGHLLRAPDGWAGVGATYETPMQGDAAIETLAAERAHASNLARLDRLLAEPPEARPLDAFDALRCVARDRLPLAGSVADRAASRAMPSSAGLHFADLPRRSGLFASYALASRGLCLAALCGEVIAASIEGEPVPLERDLLDAIDPARFLLRALRKELS